MTPADLHITNHSATDLDAIRQLLLDVYAEIYADKLSDPFFSVPRYGERIDGYASREGFGVSIGYLSDTPVGYAMGFTLPAGSGWWRGLLDPVDPALLEETGARTFALTEIMVGEPYRRRGYARRLHDELLALRGEQRATLLVLPENVAAQAAYKSWGWRRLGGVKPFDDAPVYDAMVLDLVPNRG